MSHEHLNGNVQPTQPRDTINNLLLIAREENHTISEIKVWQTDTIFVPESEVGIVATDELNGCHVSIFVAPDQDGDTMTMTHFPPGIGREGYRNALEDISASIQARGVVPKAIVTLTASDRPAIEDGWASESFPGVPTYRLFYKGKDRERRSRPDAGRCMAILDKREGASNLHVLTDSGDQIVELY
jgi:hypothetical protein